MILLGVGFGWIGIVLERTRQQKRIVESLAEFGTLAEYRYGYAVKLWWLGLGIRGHGPCDEDLAKLKGLPELKVLVLNGDNLTDNGLSHLGQMTRIERLGLVSGRVTDAGLEHFKGLRNLEYLELYLPHVTEEGIEELEKALPNCTINWRASKMIPRMESRDRI